VMLGKAFSHALIVPHAVKLFLVRFKKPYPLAILRGIETIKLYEFEKSELSSFENTTPSFQNLLEKSAKLSSDYADSYGAAMAVDGIYEPTNVEKSLTHSQRETRPWWRVDLGDVHCVWAVNILNRFTSKPNYLIC